MRVLIIGSAASAAFAIQACRDLQIEYKVISDKPPVTGQSGAFFLHWLPESLKKFAREIEVTLIPLGTAEGYTMKQWGRVVPSSFPQVEEKKWWYSSDVLQEVWRDQELTLVGNLDAKDFLDEYFSRFDWIFYTFPLQEHAREIVEFPVVDYSNGDSFLDNHVVYNGVAGDDWTRATVAFGRMSLELLPGAIPDEKYSKIWRVIRTGKLRDIPPSVKPVERDEWLAPNIVPIGRFARFDRRRLSHDAYLDVKQILEESQ